MNSTASWRRWSWLACAAWGGLATACGSGSDASATTVPFTSTASDGADASADRCLGEAFADDFALRTGDGVTLSGHATALMSATAGVVACGDGFVDIVGVGSLEHDGACTSLATAGALVLVGMASGELLALDPTTATPVSSVFLGAPIGGIATDGATVWVAAGDAGVFAVPSSDGTLGSSVALGDIADARGVALGDDGLWVAAGEAGVALLDPSSGATRATAATATKTTGVRTTTAGAAVLLGVDGWAHYEANGGALSQRSSHGTTGATLDAVEHDGEIVTADVHALVRHADDGPRYEERPGFGDVEAPWLRAVASHDGELLAALGDTLVPVDVSAPTRRPDVMVDATTVYMWGDPGEPLESLVVIDNLGDAPLVVGDLEVDAPFAVEFQDGGDPIDGCPDAVAIPGGGSLLLALSWIPTDATLVTGTVTLHTNDPDEPELTLTVDGNRGAPVVGSEAAGFDLLTLDGERFRLGDHRGKVVLVKMFNFGCKRCAEEFSTVEHEIMSAYPASDFVAVGVNTTHRTGFAGTVVDDGGLTLPMTLDLDSTAFRRYRMPEKVFPLNVVVGRDGTILHVDTEEGLVSTKSAIAAAM